jgi:APA family basic amino acid/polyamine antiporter
VNSPSAAGDRHLGLLGATGVGVGAIVGGGILALAGTAFALTGPSALLAFACNGAIAFLTAVSFAEVSSKFPQSGGTYVFAKKVLSVDSAFAVGWVVWFASIVAAVLYALGFGEFAAVAADALCRIAAGKSPSWLMSRYTVCGLAVAAALFYSAVLFWKQAGGGRWTNIGKLLVFGILIVCGLAALPGSTPRISQALRPFFTHGASGLFQAMGVTFITLQGFDLIAAVAGEVRDPERNLPRSMFLSLGIALLVYLPLLFLIATVGVPPGETLSGMSRKVPESMVAVAARTYLGAFGYWLVVVAAILSMLSALYANLLAASRIAAAMARDHTLPRMLAWKSVRRKTPVVAVAVTAVIVVGITAITPDVASAGAASSLIFLITFALAHGIAFLVRRRSRQQPPPFRAPFFPAVPAAGGLSCLALAAYQGIAVPEAGLIAAAWLLMGLMFFLGLYAHHARVADASHAASDPEMAQLRGRAPLVLVPIANPHNARNLVTLADSLAPPHVGRVLLLNVIPAPPGWRPDQEPQPLENAQSVLGKAIAASVEISRFLEALTTVGDQPGKEIGRVAKIHRCESLLLGLSRLAEQDDSTFLEQLISSVDCDVVVLRAPGDWRISEVRRILVPLGGRGGHDELLARLLGGLSRCRHREVTFLKILPGSASSAACRQEQRHLARRACDLWSESAHVEIIRSDAVVESISARAAENDLLILGAQRLGQRKKFFGQLALQIARNTPKPVLIICRRG